METHPQDTKKVFWELGTCSRTFCYLLDREFGNEKAAEEQALDPMAGGILRRGHQCGMLWGAAMAAGAEAYRRCDDQDEAIALAVKATQYIMDSFQERTDSANCRDITGTNFFNPFQMLRYMLFRARGCFDLAEKWAPEAIAAAREGLAEAPEDIPRPCLNCAVEVAGKMGAGEEEQVMVAGFAGGMGLSGNACGALGAAIWMNSLAWSREHPKKSPYANPKAKNTMKVFQQTTDSEMLCRQITGRDFASSEEHSAFIEQGGCADLIGALAAS